MDRGEASGQTKPNWFQCNELGTAFWTNSSSGEIVSADFNPSNNTWSAKPVFTTLTAPGEIEIDAHAMYFFSDDFTSVMVATRNGSGFDTPQALVTNQIQLAGFQCNENALGWANGAGEIVSAPRDAVTGLPGSPAAIAVGQAGTIGLASAETVHIGWINAGGGGQLVELTQ